MSSRLLGDVTRVARVVGHQSSRGLASYQQQRGLDGLAGHRIEIASHEPADGDGHASAQADRLELDDDASSSLVKPPVGVQPPQEPTVVADRFLALVGGASALETEVREGRFREDLFYRLNVVRVSLPPLRERAGDVELLSRYFVSEFAKRVKRPVVGVSPQALALLKRHDWPGNVRELSNTIERAVVLGDTELIIPEDLPEMLVEAKHPTATGPATYHDAVAAKKKELILDAVARAGGSITEAGKLLNLHPNYLHRLIKNLGLRDRIKST